MLLYLAVALQLNIAFAATNKIVQTKSGPIRGRIDYTLFESKPFFSFQGIPYAKPPLDDLRFRPPLKIEKWIQIKDCLQFGNICPQQNPSNPAQIIGNEDCLFVNVYTPEIKPTKPLAVMVYIHGGAFSLGSGNDDLQGADFLINKGVIVVTLNYRLGVLGFAALDHPEYSGNMGLKDQQLALKWIHCNINAFGGDNKKITIFGQSAGSGSCQYHLVSSPGLFRGIIEMSFTGTPWSTFKNNSNLIEVTNFARTSKPNIQNFNDVITFMKKIDANEIVRSFSTVLYEQGAVPIKFASLFGPVLEIKNAIQPFIQDLPENLIARQAFDTNINIMTGYCSAEALFVIYPVITQPSLLDALNKNFEIQLPSLDFNEDYSSKVYEFEVGPKIHDFYFGKNVLVNQNSTTIENYIRLLSVVFELYGINQNVKNLLNVLKGSVYYYLFDLSTQVNLYKRLFNVTQEKGALHADDLCYVFRCHLLPDLYDGITLDSSTYRYIDQMTTLYSNFAKFGNPTPYGQPVNFKAAQSNELNFLHIAMDGLKLGINPFQKDFQFWDDLIRDHPQLFGK